MGVRNVSPLQQIQLITLRKGKSLALKRHLDIIIIIIRIHQYNKNKIYSSKKILKDYTFMNQNINRYKLNYYRQKVKCMN